MGDSFKISIADCNPAKTPDPSVLVVLDPQIAFGTAVECVRQLQLGGYLPSMLVVGVARHRSDVMEILSVRRRDFTPTAPDSYGLVPESMGGAGPFHEFIRDELKPWIRNNFGGNSADTAIFGYSLAGLFATHVLLEDPGTFSRYALGSPALWWDEGSILDRVGSSLRVHPTLSARVACTVGGYETPSATEDFMSNLSADEKEKATILVSSIDMVDDARRLVRTLNDCGIGGLSVSFDLLPNEFHLTGTSLSMSRSLRRLYGVPM